MEEDNPNFSRRFGEVIHYMWLYGDGNFDLVRGGQATMDLVDKVGESYAEENGKYSLFRRLSPCGTQDAILWLEKYRDVQAWAAAELHAQRSPEWMNMILQGQTSDLFWDGESHMMVDDSLTQPKAVSGDQLSVEWISYDSGKLAALTKFPELIAQLANESVSAGFDESSVRFFGMPTCAGNDLSLSHIWIEHPRPSLLGEFAAWRSGADVLKDWRKALYESAGEYRSHYFLTSAI